MILYIGNPKKTPHTHTKKLLETINKHSKLSGYKINVQKPTAFLYTKNETSEKEMNKTIPFAFSKKRKYLEINLTKEVNDLYTEN